MQTVTGANKDGDSLARYTSVAKLLHWLIALLILVQIPLGLTMGSAPDVVTKFKLFQLHKSLGITVLLLMILRLAWRLAIKPPKLPASLGWFETLGAHFVHFSLYILLFALPLTGWAIVSASKLPIPTLLYQAIPWPHIPWLASLPADAKAPWSHTFSQMHEVLGYALLALVIFHIFAALYHGVYLRDGVLSRMVPTLKNKTSLKTLALAVLFGGAFAGLSTTSAKATEWSIKPDQSSVGFEATGSGYTTKGSFGRYKCEIDFDPETPKDAAIKVVLDMESATTGANDVDSTLASSDYFDPAQYPAATFVARGAKAQGAGRYLLEGQLTLKGVTKPVQLPFSFKVQNGLASVAGETTINRLDFGVGPQSVAGLVIDSDVKLTISLTALRLDN